MVIVIVVVVVVDQTKTRKGTLGPAGRGNIPNMCGTRCESECRVMKRVLEMGVVGGEGEPGEEGIAAVGVSAYVGAKMIAKMAFTLHRATGG